ncbi:ATP-binding protein [Bacteroides fragilis]|uniref:ATP-binding protein n=1 Tax=Bacteroides fragilis TaxID=817 RepID=UPI00202F479A|nr:ATP-binding protein [Bacteroides fragilis]MCM0248166.1 ATP-binding protein [Bacteroides fragilis]MCM0256659.1 ATP-binding protein [Bacteroides fragilis]
MDICNTMSRKLPIGIQSFEKLRTGGYLYVDKTELVYRLAKAGIPCFLSRPRRFGKSLLLSTLEAYFLGKKDLFKGLAIERLEQDWLVYPVMHLSLNAEKYDSNERLANLLESQLEAWEAEYGVTEINRSYSIRFMTVIRRAYEQTGRRVVVLVDEYDKPMLRSFDNPELQRDFRETLMAFYTVLKDADAYLQLVFITGVTKFAQMGIFSNLNQLQDISLHPAYTTLCGMTRAEIEAVFAPELQSLARGNGLTYEEAMDKLGRQYDGYHFNYRNWEGMFNPFSVLNTFSTGLFENAWFASGTPTFLAEMLRKTDFDLRDLDGIEVSSASLSDDRADIHNPVPMIYQSGYLTIKKYDPQFGLYTLGFPNEEVKYGFLNFVAPFYTPVASTDTAFYIGKFVRELTSGDVEAFLERLRCFFADFPYELNTKTERHYQVVFYLVFKLMGQFTEAEVRSARGRADAVVKTADYTYVFEFKLDGSAEAALQQIEEKGYSFPYGADGRKLVKVGVSFDAEQRNLGEWLIVE